MTQANPTKAVLFDLDGVLVSTDRFHYQAWKIIAKEENVADFENFIMHHICARAAKYRLPIQFHAGTGPGGYWAYLNFSVRELTSLILQHPDTIFDVMHGGYPNYGECGALVSHFANVYANLSWMIMISDAEARRVLDNWLDYVPVNKIMWGGDCQLVEQTYGTYLVARQQIIEVLGNKIAREQITQEDGLLYLERIFCDNAQELFGLKLTDPKDE